MNHVELTNGYESQNTGFRIKWKSANGECDRVGPTDVLGALVERMTYEQGTEGLASDANARALALVIQAKAVLDGKKTETDDGIPIIE